MNADILINLAYIVASVLFILGIKMLGRVETAKRGNRLSAVGMLLAAGVTFFDKHILEAGHEPALVAGLFVAALVLGTAIGLVCAYKVPVTSMPEMVALLNGLGGLSSLLVAAAEVVRAALRPAPEATLAAHEAAGAAPPWFIALAVVLTVAVGAVTFSGSLIAWAKLAGKMDGKPILFGGQKAVNALVLLVIAAGGLAPVILAGPQAPGTAELACYGAVALAALLLGVLGTIPIGGGDMPVVISLLNSLSGLAAAFAGFILLNNVLIVAGCLVGTSGLILTVVMCKAMNRDLASVLFAGFGAETSGAGAGAAGGEAVAEPKAASVDDAWAVLEAARAVVIIPGYGMAVAQAQHAVKELSDLLEANGAEVRYAIHPVAGRMPGHMNVLLAEADVPYEQLWEMDAINPQMPAVDVAIVIGANDVVNPAAATDKGSPIYGMPIIKAHEARTVYVLKRGKGKGFSGLENALFIRPNTRMLYGDAKATITKLAGLLKSA